MMRLFASIAHSLPARLLAVFLLTAFIFLCITSIMWGIGLRHQWNTRIHPHIVQYVDYINKDLGTPPSIERARQLGERLPINIYVTGPDTEFSSNGLNLDEEEIDFDKPRHKKRHLEKIRADSGVDFDVGEYDDRVLFRSRRDGYTIYYELRRSDGHRPPKKSRHLNSRPGKHILWFTLCSLGLVMVFCYWMIRRLISPIGDIQAGVRAMGAGKLNHRITVARNDDLGELTHSINDMAQDIEQMLDAKRQLLLAISHELRSPITRARISAELLPQSDSRQRIEDDLKEMEGLISELLESERLNSAHSVLNPSEVDVKALVDEVVAENFQSGVVVTSNVEASSYCLDEARVRMLVRNLISNALRHGGGESVEVTLTGDASTATIDVRDYGVGIAADQIPNLTQPLYRVDESRTRSSGGFGLGLYLCRLITEAHGGALSIDSTLGEGTTVSATLRSQPVRNNNPTLPR